MGTQIEKTNLGVKNAPSPPDSDSEAKLPLMSTLEERHVVFRSPESPPDLFPGVPPADLGVTLPGGLTVRSLAINHFRDSSLSAANCERETLSWDRLRRIFGGDVSSRWEFSFFCFASIIEAYTDSKAD